MQNKLLLILSALMLVEGTVLGTSVLNGGTVDEAAIVIKKIPKVRKKRRKPVLTYKSIKEQSVAELKQNLAEYLKSNLDLAIKYLEALIPKLVEFDEIRDARLQLADVFFKTSRYDKAGSVYLEYYEAYPGYARAEYALSQAIAAKYKQIGACDQDSVVTKEILDLSKQYLQNKTYKKYRKQVSELFEGCNTQVFEAEIKIFEHYFRQGQLGSAQRRLDYMVARILPQRPDIKDRITELQDLVNQAKNGKNPFKLLKNFNNGVQNKQTIDEFKAQGAKTDGQAGLATTSGRSYTERF